MNDATDIHLDELYLSEIQQLLSAEGQAVTLDQAQMIANFVKEVGGLTAALEVLGQLRQDRSAA